MRLQLTRYFLSIFIYVHKQFTITDHAPNERSIGICSVKLVSVN